MLSSLNPSNYFLNMTLLYFLVFGYNVVGWSSCCPSYRRTWCPIPSGKEGLLFILVWRSCISFFTFISNYFWCIDYTILLILFVITYYFLTHELCHSFFNGSICTCRTKMSHQKKAACLMLNWVQKYYIPHQICASILSSISSKVKSIPLNFILQELTIWEKYLSKQWDFLIRILSSFLVVIPWYILDSAYNVYRILFIIYKM